jgi:hypothetical protein
LRRASRRRLLLCPTPHDLADVPREATVVRLVELYLGLVVVR